MNLSHQANLYLDCQNQLGEGPIWDHRTQELIWVDIEGQSVFARHPASGRQLSWSLPQRVGTVVPAQNPQKLIVALENGVHRLDRGSGALQLLVDPEPDLPGNRLNDGKCDPAGRLWVGSMNLAESHVTGGLYRIDAAGSSQKMLTDIGISNGLCWSADAKTFYYIDTPTRQVQAFDFDQMTGLIAGGRVVIEIPTEMGYPDGMTIDAEGMLWIALWNGAAVGRWDPATGTLLQRIDVPAWNVTACAFGGPNLDTLYISSARIKTDLSRFPEAGGIFVVQPGVRGRESDFFG